MRRKRVSYNQQRSENYYNSVTSILIASSRSRLIPYRLPVGPSPALEADYALHALKHGITSKMNRPWLSRTWKEFFILPTVNLSAHSVHCTTFRALANGGAEKLPVNLT